MNKNVFLIILIFLSWSYTNAQNIEVDTGFNYVIANGGLKLRNGPSKKHKTLLIIPFGSQVQYMDHESYSIDSINIINEEYSKTYYGNWVKVKFNNTIGFVLDSYLFYKSEGESRFNLDANKNYFLLFPGCGCSSDNIYNPSEWHLYGYYLKEDNLFEVKKVNVSYLSTKQYTCDLLITVSELKDLQFVIGYKYPPSIFSGLIISKEIYYTYENAITLLPKFGLKCSSYPGDLSLELENKRQILSRTEFDLLTDIYFIANFDGDQKNDFIIGYGDKGHIKVLYLSSLAKANELLKIVAIFFGGYCC